MYEKRGNDGRGKGLKIGILRRKCFCKRKQKKLVLLGFKGWHNGGDLCLVREDSGLSSAAWVMLSEGCW